MELFLDDLLAAAGLADTPPAPTPYNRWRPTEACCFGLPLWGLR
jgi:hypothetical protein